MIAMLERLIRTKRKTGPKLDFVPVIFANGVDDDLPGLVAALKDERVQYGSKIYKKGETIDIIGKQLALSCNCLVLKTENETLYVPPRREGFDYSNPVVIRIPELGHGRNVNVTGCHIRFNATPRM